MTHGVKRIYIGVMKESVKGLSYWVKIERDDGGRISPYMSYIMDRSIYTAAEWAHFFGIEVERLEPIESIGLTQELIDAGYKEAEFMVEGLEVKDWQY
jgi:hypothetical protein